MAEISFESLTLEQKAEKARELYGECTQRELAQRLDVTVKRVRKWTEGMVKRPVIRLYREALTEEETCHCSVPASDPNMDALCRRTATCFWCGKPPAHTTRPRAVRSAQEA